MSVRRREWEIAESRVTPESIFLNRRALILAGGLLAAGALVGVARSRGAGSGAASFPAASPVVDPSRALYPAARNPRYGAARAVTPEEINTTNNSFYEFGRSRNIAREAEALAIRPWTVRIDGLVEREFTLGIDDLLRRVTLEERVYRHRAVEGWSMVVPWTGFPLKALVEMAKPLGSAKYLRLESFDDPAMASGQRQVWYPWPYVEGLTMAEATHDLALVVTGAYGKPVAKSMGAPIRVHLPWKYGFKSAKSLVRFSFVEDRPVTFRQALNPHEYGFWANVNPEVPHPRWSQATERDIGTGEIQPTRLFNGYADTVAGLYGGLAGEALYM
jgi:sulfoxide reductase catalytic subunit YedY